MRFSFSLCLLVLVPFVSAELGTVTELAGLKASKNCDPAKKPNVAAYIANGQYALVSRKYFENPPVVSGYMCGAAVAVVNKNFPGNTVQFSNIAIVDICETCGEFDIQLGPKAFSKVSGGASSFPAEWGRYICSVSV
ncbi:hypothetical protein B0H34DRAFT_795718 [Crassisporium funariophilum]|nr:hypothetical protein B0H34DRAFT_795718 [Crassisporium funariophilum]